MLFDKWIGMAMAERVEGELFVRQFLEPDEHGERFRVIQLEWYPIEPEGVRVMEHGGDF
jgi:hypothetical protein